MYRQPPMGITPPTPGLEHEEPEFAIEDDIPVEDQTRQPSEPDPQADVDLE